MSRAFAQIQRHEARLATARRARDDAQARCPARCAAHDEMGRQRDALCGIAEGLGDVDALRRCRDAGASCSAGARALDHDCGCAAAHL